MWPLQPAARNSVGPVVRGSALKETAPPTDTTLTICMSYFMAEDPDKELKTNKLPTPQLEDFRKGQKEMPGVRPPPRILLAGIHLG